MAVVSKTRERRARDEGAFRPLRGGPPVGGETRPDTGEGPVRHILHLLGIKAGGPPDLAGRPHPGGTGGAIQGGGGLRPRAGLLHRGVHRISFPAGGGERPQAEEAGPVHRPWRAPCHLEVHGVRAGERFRRRLRGESSPPWNWRNSWRRESIPLAYRTW